LTLEKRINLVLVGRRGNSASAVNVRKGRKRFEKKARKPWEGVNGKDRGPTRIKIIKIRETISHTALQKRSKITKK